MKERERKREGGRERERAVPAANVFLVAIDDEEGVVSKLL